AFAVVAMTARAGREIDLLALRQAALHLGVEVDAGFEKMLRRLGVPSLRERCLRHLQILTCNGVTKGFRRYRCTRQYAAHDQRRSPDKLDAFHSVVEPVVSCVVLMLMNAEGRPRAGCPHP